MKVLEKGVMPDGTEIQIEEWNENYVFMPYGSTIGSYPISKKSHMDRPFGPRDGKEYRFSFNFQSYEETKEIFNDLLSGNKALSELKGYMNDPRYSNCL